MSRRSRETHARSITFILCMGMLAGVLIWAKLRLVTDIPRSAYADPEEIHPGNDEHVDEDVQELTPETSDDNTIVD